MGTIREINGEYEYTTEYLFKTENRASEFAEETAMNWRGGTEENFDEDQEGYWCDHTLICNDGIKEVPEEDFIVLSKYLVVM
jgi:hypothetical protein